MTKLSGISLAVVVGLAIVGPPIVGHADFDRNQCYVQCGKPTFRGTQLPGQVWLTDLAQATNEACIQECDRKFWQDFEEKTKRGQGKDW